MASSLEALQYISNVQDLVDLHDFIDDEKLAEAIDLAIKCIAKPDPDIASAKRAMLMMQGYAFQFKMQALVYMQIHTGKTGSVENVKKNAYMYASEQCHELAQTLKYIVKDALI